MENTRVTKTKKIALAGLFCALAYICVALFRFKVAFLTFDIKDAFTAIAAMMLGPVYGIIIAFIVALLEMITMSETGLYGFIMNVLSSVSFVFVASLIYKYNKKMMGAIIGLVSAAISMVAVMMIANLIITPVYYTKILGVPMSVADVAKIIPTLLLPFNSIKAAVNASLTMILYKPLSRIFKRVRLIEGKLDDKKSFNAKSILSFVISVVIIAISLCILFLVLNGTIKFGK